MLLASAPVCSKSEMKYCASSLVMPMAANTTMKFSSLPTTLACRAIWSAISLCGSPDPEKMGSFWPRTSVFIKSMLEIPVWMKSWGDARENGLMAAPPMSSRFSGMMSGPPSMGFPAPLMMRPTMSLETASLSVVPRNFTTLWVSMPCVPSKTCTTTTSSEVSSTCPVRTSPLDKVIFTISL